MDIIEIWDTWCNDALTLSNGVSVCNRNMEKETNEKCSRSIMGYAIIVRVSKLLPRNVNKYRESV